MTTDILIEMLRYKRPNGSRAERAFIKRFIAPTGAKPDDRGNYILRIGTEPILWSAHTDTVHREQGAQHVYVNKNGVASAPHSNCLGADDTTGCWIMLNMIEAGVEGLYIFHRGEEVGCEGSGHIARYTPELLDGIQFAVAFDRAGYDSVITHQCGSRTASDEFAHSLSDQIGLWMLPDPTGVFTDTESYADIIPECTNVSVGYSSQHSKHEVQDLVFAEWLRDAMLCIDSSVLVCKRDPAKARDSDNWWLRGTGWRRSSSSVSSSVVLRDPYVDRDEPPTYLWCQMCGALGNSTNMFETLDFEILCQECAKVAEDEGVFVYKVA